MIGASDASPCGGTDECTVLRIGSSSGMFSAGSIACARAWGTPPSIGDRGVVGLVMLGGAGGGGTDGKGRADALVGTLVTLVTSSTSAVSRAVAGSSFSVFMTFSSLGEIPACFAVNCG